MGKKHLFFYVSKLEVYRHQKHIRLFLFHVHMGTVMQRWKCFVSKIKMNVLTNCANTSFWLVLNITVSAD